MPMRTATSPVAAGVLAQPGVEPAGAGHDPESREPFRDRPVVRESDVVRARSSQRAEGCYPRPHFVHAPSEVLGQPPVLPTVDLLQSIALDQPLELTIELGCERP